MTKKTSFGPHMNNMHSWLFGGTTSIVLSNSKMPNKRVEAGTMIRRAISCYRSGRATRAALAVKTHKMTNDEHPVRKFYEKICNQHNHKMIPEVLHENLRFRGSLGLTKYGHSEFKEYLEMVHEAIGEYQCNIDDLVCEPNKVFTRMTFTGIHKGKFMGFPPTGKRVTWLGAALFTFEGWKVTGLWVLGDLISLERQLKEAQM